jgi:hypothetical protein
MSPMIVVGNKKGLCFRPKDGRDSPNSPLLAKNRARITLKDIRV